MTGQWSVRPEDIKEWLAPEGSVDARVPSLVDSIPASSKLNRSVTEMLRRLAQDPATEPRLRTQLARVIEGEESLSSLLASGGLPAPSYDQVPPEVQRAIHAFDDRERDAEE